MAVTSSSALGNAAAKFLGKVEKAFSLSDDQLKEMIPNFHQEMAKGLKGESSTLKMIPSYVGMPSGKEVGSFYALDLGGTNFRVLQIKLKGQGKITQNPAFSQYKIPENLMTGTGEALFDFIATSVKDFVEKNPPSDKIAQIGFTFSFPVKQTAINSGSLIKWTKGFTASDVEGNDVVELLKKAFERNGVKGNISALVNDTVGTMVAKAYSEHRSAIGVILGTGTNACYIENTETFGKKLDSPYLASHMIVNMEWGAFSDGTTFLPLTDYDKSVDQLSPNQGKQLFEKMISGMYLGELLRQMLVEYVKVGGLKGKAEKKLATYNSMDASAVSIALGPNNLTKIKSDIFVKLLGYNADDISADDVQLTAALALLISTRAAKLSAMGVAAVAQWIAVTRSVSDLKSKGLVCAVDGGVFEKTPGFSTTMKSTLESLVTQFDIELVLSKDGSGLGAAIIAATASQ